jgi:hypothetical protein
MATTYYVSPTGNDAASGTSRTTAWQTLTKVNAVTFAAGDIILFERSGSWNGTLTVKSSGTVGNPITYGAYGEGAKPKIYGSEVITGWTLHSGNIYKKVLATNIYQLFINNNRAVLARYPKSGWASITTKNSETQFISTGITSQGADYYKNATWVGKTNLYTIVQKTVTTSTGQTITIDTAPEASLGVGEGFFLCDKLEFLTQAGEWCFDAATKTVYAWMPNGDSPANYSIQGSVYDYGVNMQSFDFITAKDLELTQQNLAGVYIYNSGDDNIVDNCAISKIQGVGIYCALSGRRLTFTNNTILDVYAAGIHINYTNATPPLEPHVVKDNTINTIGRLSNIGRRTSLAINPGNAIAILQGNADITYNKISNCGYIGILFYSGIYNINHNFVDGALMEMNDGAAFYCFSGTYSEAGVSGSVIEYNIALNINGNLEGTPNLWPLTFGVYFDSKIHGVTVRNNTFAKGMGGMNFNGGGENIFENNTCFDLLLDINSAGQEAANTVAGNIYYKTARTGALLYLGTTHERFVDQRTNADNNFNNNTYVVHYTETNVFVQYANFAAWQAAGNDINGSYDGTNMVVGETEEIFYNDTKVTKTFYLGSSVYKDINGTQVTVSFTLEPFTSRILIKTTGTTGDVTKPVVTAFTIEPTSNSLTIHICTFAATDNVGVVGYKITESATAPLAADAGWTATIPTHYTFVSEGTKTLYGWAKDADGNVSTSVSDQTVIALLKIGNQTVYATTTASTGNRRAYPVTMTENGFIVSIMVYHGTAAAGDEILVGVYTDSSSKPQNRIGTSVRTQLAATEGWQEIPLTAPVYVAKGQTIWIAWMMEKAVTMRYAAGAVTRATKTMTFPSMPSTFGTATYSNLSYSIYAKYSK